jgi:ankyrin repeat protein
MLTFIKSRTYRILMAQKKKSQKLKESEKAPTAQLQKKSSLLELAVCSRDEDIFQSLLDCKPEVMKKEDKYDNTLLYKDEYGNTLLYYVMLHNKKAVVEVLLKKGVCTNIPDKDWETIFNTAELFKRTEIIELLKREQLRSELTSSTVKNVQQESTSYSNDQLVQQHKQSKDTVSVARENLAAGMDTTRDVYKVGTVKEKIGFFNGLSNNNLLQQNKSLALPKSKFDILESTVSLPVVSTESSKIKSSALVAEPYVR